MKPVFCACLCGLLAAPWCTPSAHAATTSSSYGKTVEVVISDQGLQPSTIVATDNRTIHLHITNKSGEPLQFSIPAFYIFTRTLAPGETSDVEFAPYKVGSFDMYSDPNTAQSRHDYRGRFRVHE